jgi:hypothetical protein
MDAIFPIEKKISTTQMDKYDKYQEKKTIVNNINEKNKNIKVEEYSVNILEEKIDIDGNRNNDYTDNDKDLDQNMDKNEITNIDNIENENTDIIKTNNKDTNIKNTDNNENTSIENTDNNDTDIENTKNENNFIKKINTDIENINNFPKLRKFNAEQREAIDAICHAPAGVLSMMMMMMMLS